MKKRSILTDFIRRFKKICIHYTPELCRLYGVQLQPLHLSSNYWSNVITMETKLCPKCGHETYARFLITHKENGEREGEYKWVCNDCENIVDRLKILIS